MESSTRKIIIGAGIFAATIVVAVVGYWLAGWSLLESFYMVIITIFGVGYGEVRPVEETWLRLFTIGFIITGCTSAVFVMGGFVQMIAEGEINRALGAHRMSTGIRSLKNHVILCGYGRVGQMLAHELNQQSKPFVIVDRDREKVIEAQCHGHYAYVGDATDEETLTSIGIDRASVLATVLPNDALNVFITLTARELNDGIQIIARGECVSTKRKLLRSGANEVVMPAAVGACRIAQIIKEERHDNSSSISGSYETKVVKPQSGHSTSVGLLRIEITALSGHAGKSLGQALQDLGSEVLPLSILKADGTMLPQPSESVTLAIGDTIVAMSSETKANQNSFTQEKEAPTCTAEASV